MSVPLEKPVLDRIANFLHGSNGIKVREGILDTKRVEYFKGMGDEGRVFMLPCDRIFVSCLDERERMQ